MGLFLTLDNDVNDFLHYCFVVEIRFSLGAEFYRTGFEGKECVVSADTDIFPRKDFGPSLANNDRAALRFFSSVQLGTEVLRL